jgi:ABC-2 type transport system ATP-binding protein
VAIIAAGRVLACDVPERLGGRHAGQATVTWSDPDGTPRTEITETPTALVTRLASEFGGEVPELNVRRPTLEDTYLELVGAETGTDEDVAREGELLA